MRTSDADILIIPGWGGSGPGHWQQRWEQKLPTARVIAQPDWYKPDRELWAGNILSAIREATKPVVLVAHSAGVSSVAHAAEFLKPGEVAGGFLVAPPSERAKRAIPAMPGDFATHRRAPLPFPAVLIASANDPYATMEDASELAEAWGVRLIEAGESGHINVDSGHGPWPEGLMSFAAFLKGL